MSAIQKRLKLGEILLKNKVISEEQLNKALEIQEASHRLLGEILIESGYVSKDKLDFILSRQAGVKLGEALLNDNLISYQQLQDALKLQSETTLSLGQILINTGLISEDKLLGALSEQYNIPYVELSHYPINPEAFSKVPIDILRRYNVLPIDIKGNFLILATADPMDIIAQDDISFLSGMYIDIVLSSSDEIKSYLD